MDVLIAQRHHAACATFNEKSDGSGPEAFAELVQRETRKWSDVVTRSGAKVD